MTKLENLANIRTGFTFRGSVEDCAEGTIKVLQIKDVRGRTVVDTTKLDRILWETKSAPPTLEINEVVIVSRGDRNYAALFTSKDCVVPSSQLFVITVTNSNVLPAFLVWYFNYSEAAQKYFSEHQSGTSISTISKSALLEMPIQVPTLLVQQKIIEIQKLADLEQQVTQELHNNRAQMLRGIFKQLLED